MRKLTLAAMLAASTLATPALAQDTNPVFTGLRIEGMLGYDNVGAGSDSDTERDGDDQSIDGVLYGVGVGYDFAAGGALLGIEGELTDSSGKVEVTDPGDRENFGFGRVGTGRDLYVGARAGILANPLTLLYVKGGYTNTKLDVLARNGEDELETDFDLEGWRLGAGVERAIGTNTFAKLEYRYSNYNDATAQFDGDDISDTFDIDTDRHQVVASFGFRF